MKSSHRVTLFFGFILTLLLLTFACDQSTVSRDLDQFNLLHDSVELLKFSNPERALEIAREGKTLTAEYGNLSHEGSFLADQAMVFSVKGNLEVSDSMALLSLSFGRKIEDDELRTRSLLILSNNANESGRLSESKEYLKQCESLLSKEISGRVHGDFYYHSGNNSLKSNLLEESLEDFIKAQLVFDSIGDFRSGILARNSKSYTLRKVGLHEEALLSINEAFDLLANIPKGDRIDAQALLHEKKALSFYDLGAVDSALYHFDRATELCNTAGNVKKELIISNKLVEVFFEQNEFEKSLFWAQNSKRICRENDLFFANLHLARKALVLAEVNQFREAEETIRKSYESAVKRDKRLEILNVSLVAAKVFLTMERPIQAEKFLKELRGDSTAVSFPKIYLNLIETYLEIAKRIDDQELFQSLNAEYALLLKESHRADLESLRSANSIRRNLYRWEEKLSSSRARLEFLQAQSASQQKTHLLQLTLLGLALVTVVLVIFFKNRLAVKSRLVLEYENQLLKSEKELAQKDLKSKEEEHRKQISAMTQKIALTNTITEELLQEMEKIKSGASIDDGELLDQLRSFTQSKKGEGRDWEAFTLYFEKLYPLFIDRLKQVHPSLTSSEIRFCCLLHIQLTTKEIANILGISPMSANSARYRIRKKMGMKKEEKLSEILNQLTF
ncbi:MAG: hypothetical protein AAGC47_11665 [Bacteroidota bacterium]